MPLKAPGNHDKMLPIAYIPDGWGNKDGILICQDSNGGSFRTGYNLPELLEYNPKELVMGYVKNLKENFFEWLTTQSQKYNSDRHRDYRWTKRRYPTVLVSA